MANTLEDIIDRYTKIPPDVDPRDRHRAVTVKISLESMILLETIAEHVGKKKTPLLGEIADAAVKEVFAGLEAEMDHGLLSIMQQRMVDEGVV